MDNDRTESVEIQTRINTRPFQGGDISALQPILERWIRDSITGEAFPDEVQGVIDAMTESAQVTADRMYLVAESSQDGVIGVIGFRQPEERMLPFITDRAVELINAYVAEDQRGKGVGTSLIQALEREAVNRGVKQVVFNSGPRYKDTAWAFYDRLQGYERVGEAKNMYGEGRHAPVWRKDLVEG